MPNLKDSKSKKLVKSDFDFHVEMVKKIDKLLEKHEGEKENKELESAPQQGIIKSLKDLVEVREPFERKPEMPHHKEKEIGSNKTLNTTNIENELFDIEHPDGVQSDFRFVTSLEDPKDFVRVKNPDSEHVEDGDFHSWMLGDQNKNIRNATASFANMKAKTKKKDIKNKDKNADISVKKTGQVNGYTKTKIELEKTKQEIEKKKQELEEAECKEREKEKELKKKKIEKIKKEKEQEKRKKLEMKKAREEAKIREKELKKKELEMRKKKREEEKIKALEAKKAEREAEIKERELEKKRKDRLEKKQKEEKLKSLELKKKEEEAVKQSRLKEKEKKLKEKKSEKKKIEKSKKEPLTVFKRKEKTEKKATEKDRAIFVKKEETNLDKELKEVLAIADKLLESLPDEVIDEFVQSKDFELYEKVLSKYKIK